MAMMQATVRHTDGIKLMTTMLNRYAFARDGAEVCIEVGDVYNGPPDIGRSIVILTVDGMRGMFPMADAVLFMEQLCKSAVDWETRKGELPDKLQEMINFAGQILRAVEAYHAQDAAKRARAN